MYSTFLVLTLLTSLATRAPLSSDSSVLKAGLVTRNLQDSEGYGGSIAEGDQARSDERVSSPSQRAPQITTRQLQFSDIESGQQISDDAMEQYGSGILAMDRGTRIKRSCVDELSKTHFEWVRSTAKSSAEKHARDTNEGLSAPKSRTYCRPGAGTRSGGRGKGETLSNELLAVGEASGAQGETSAAQNGGNSHGAEGGGHVANVGGQNNGFAFGQAVRFPEK